LAITIGVFKESKNTWGEIYCETKIE